MELTLLHKQIWNQADVRVDWSKVCLELTLLHKQIWDQAEVRVDWSKVCLELTLRHKQIWDQAKMREITSVNKDGLHEEPVRQH